MKPLLIAHRGNTNNFPENTIEAFKAAFENGADGIELDVQFYKGKLIVVHDYSFDKNRSYPLLSQILQLFFEKGRIEIEIKSLDLDFIPTFKKLLSKYRKTDIEITTSIYPLVSYLRTEFSYIPLGIIFGEKEFEDWMTKEFSDVMVIKMMKLFRANVAHVPWRIVDENFVKDCHNKNMKIHGHIYKQTLDEQLSIYKKMEKLDIDQCTFDDMSLLAALKK